jgi:tetratricopeptide (TPR) repeat protein
MKSAILKILSLSLVLGSIALSEQDQIIETQRGSEVLAPEEGLSMAIATSSPIAQQHVVTGIAHLLSSWDEAAYVEFKQALELDPNCLMAHWGLVFSCIQLPTDHITDRNTSLQRINEIVELGGENIPQRELEYLKALNQLLRQENRLAALVFADIADQWPRDPWAPLFRCIVERDGFKASGSPNEGQSQAREHIRIYLQKHPDTPVAHFIKALLEETNPSIDAETIQSANQAVMCNPQSATAHLLLGCLLFHQGEYESAINHFQTTEELASKWQKQKQLTIADNDLYFKAATWRSVALSCLGKDSEALKLARNLMRLPVDIKRPQSRGTAFQLWEIQSLPLRVSLGRITTLSQKALNELMPKSLKGLPASLSPAIPLLCKQALVARMGAKDQLGGLRNTCQSISKLTEALTNGQKEAEKEGTLSFWARSVRLASRLEVESQAILYPNSATLLLQKAEEQQTIESLLMPPSLPYPAEWTSAQYFSKQKNWRQCLESCEMGLKRFPKHKGLEQLRQRAQTHLKNTNS